MFFKKKECATFTAEEANKLVDKFVKTQYILYGNNIDKIINDEICNITNLIKRTSMCGYKSESVCARDFLNKFKTGNLKEKAVNRLMELLMAAGYEVKFEPDYNYPTLEISW